MPVKRRRSKRRENIEPAEWAFLIDEPYPNGEDGFVNWVLEFDYNGHATTRWLEYGEAATAEFVSKHPGQRPKLWWRYSAPEPWGGGETQDEYLERLGLWLPGERERLGPRSNVMSALAAEPSH